TIVERQPELREELPRLRAGRSAVLVVEDRIGHGPPCSTRAGPRRLLHGSVRLERGAQRVGDEAARAQQERALALGIVDRPTLHDALDDVPGAPQDGERALVAGVERLAIVQAIPVGHSHDVLLDVLLGVELAHEVGVGLDVLWTLKWRWGHAHPDRAQRVVAVEHARVRPADPAFGIRKDGEATL